MEHIKAIGIKFVIIAFTVYAIFGVFHQANLINLLWISVLTTIIAYAIGDLLILRMFGNVVASFADFGLTFVSLWVLGNMFIWGNIPIITLSLISAFLIACSEPFVHGFVVNKITGTRHDNRTLNQLQTEFAEETDPKSEIDQHRKG
ncbi:YndM family protein [Oceanobacillus halotolerans]|uniref:YndM family protein n=1 Tax=Oceanobacillus halotolerans TaxID=2663380 RepID=UPI0013DC34AD|nr:YndM family protein [Oceanobacillus halotolerans]